MHMIFDATDFIENAFLRSDDPANVGIQSLRDFGRNPPRAALG